MPAGTNTTSCTSSLGLSEFLAKITAGMAEAGGTETKQSQEHGVSGFHNAICEEAGMIVSLSCHLSTILARIHSREPFSQHVQTLRKDTFPRFWKPSMPCVPTETPTLSPSSRFGSQQADADPARSVGPGPALLRAPALRGIISLSYPSPRQESSHDPLLFTPSGFPNAVRFSPSLPAPLPPFGVRSVPLDRGSQVTWKALAPGAEPEPSTCSPAVAHQGARQHHFLEGSGLPGPAWLPASRAQFSGRMKATNQRATAMRSLWQEGAGGGKEPT